MEALVCSGPIFKRMTIEGRRARLSFDHAGGGLVAREGDLREFAVAGADRKFAPANARIEGGQVVVWSDDVAKPVAVRYAWTNDPKCNLVNRESLPASPFRTDTWPIGEAAGE